MSAQPDVKAELRQRLPLARGLAEDEIQDEMDAVLAELDEGSPGPEWDSRASELLALVNKIIDLSQAPERKLEEDLAFQAAENYRNGLSRLHPNPEGGSQFRQRTDQRGRLIEETTILLPEVGERTRTRVILDAVANAELDRLQKAVRDLKVNGPEDGLRHLSKDELQQRQQIIQANIEARSAAESELDAFCEGHGVAIPSRPKGSTSPVLQGDPDAILDALRAGSLSSDNLYQVRKSMTQEQWDVLKQKADAEAERESV